MNTIFAVVLKDEIINLIVGEYYNCHLVAKANYGEDTILVDTTNYNVEIGDRYKDNMFLHKEAGTNNWIPIMRTPTESDRITELQNEISQLKNNLTNIYNNMLMNNLISENDIPKNYRNKVMIKESLNK